MQIAALSPLAIDKEDLDKNVLNKLINKYKINYIILGNREKNKYNIKNLENLSGSIKLVYSNNTTQIYKTITIQEKNFIN